MIDLAIQNHAEAAHRIAYGDVTTGLTGELFGYEHRLAEEVFHLAGSRDQYFVIVRQLFNAQDGDDILQVFVALQHLLHFTRGGIVIVADDFRLKNVAGAG